MRGVLTDEVIQSVLNSMTQIQLKQLKKKLKKDKVSVKTYLTGLLYADLDKLKTKH